MSKLMESVKMVDPEVEEQLAAQEIKPQYYSFRLIIFLSIFINLIFRFKNTTILDKFQAYKGQLIIKFLFYHSN